MACPPKPTPADLSFLEQASGNAHRFAPFALLRALEARLSDRPRIGESRLPAQNVADLRQPPTLAFPAASVHALTQQNGRVEVQGHWLGLTGPMGPMPLHLSEFAAYERRYSASQPYGDFLGLVSGRMLQLFYRAWASGIPAASADRPDDDRFAAMLADLTGAYVGVPDNATFPKAARLRYAALYASPRSALAIEDALSDLMRARVEITQFVARWREIETQDRSRLGQSFAGLGRDAVAGAQVEIADAAFRVTIFVASFRDYQALLPGTHRFSVLCEALAAFAPTRLDWAIELAVTEAQVPPAGLGGQTRLGWTSWVAPGAAATRLRKDARIGRAQSRRYTSGGKA